MIPLGFSGISCFVCLKRKKTLFEILKQLE